MSGGGGSGGWAPCGGAGAVVQAWDGVWGAEAVDWGRVHIVYGGGAAGAGDGECAGEGPVGAGRSARLEGGGLGTALQCSPTVGVGRVCVWD